MSNTERAIALSEKLLAQIKSRQRDKVSDESWLGYTSRVTLLNAILKSLAEFSDQHVDVLRDEIVKETINTDHQNDVAVAMRIGIHTFGDPFEEYVKNMLENDI